MQVLSKSKDLRISNDVFKKICRDLKSEINENKKEIEKPVVKTPTAHTAEKKAARAAKSAAKGAEIAKEVVNKKTGESVDGSSDIPVRLSIAKDDNNEWTVITYKEAP